MTFNVDVTDGNTHELSLYAVDWDATNRGETITLSDDATGTVLDTQTISAFHDGEYLSWNISGDVDVTVTKNTGANAVISGLFFDPAAAIAPPTNVQVLPSPGEVDLTWTAASSGGTYNVYRTDSDGNTTQVGTNITGTRFSDTSPTNGTTYTYAVSVTSDGAKSAPSDSSDPTTPGGIWIPVLDSNGNPVTVTPSITSDAVSDFDAGSALPAGTYRVDYTGGTMTYDNSDQGYRVNAWNNSNNTDGFEISLNGTIAPTTDHHAPGTDAQETIPTTPFAGVTGQSFTFTPTSTDTIGVYLHDNPYSDNQAYRGDATPTFTLEESVTETSLTATDAISGQTASTPASAPLSYAVDGSGNATLSLSTTTSPSPIPTGYSEFYEISSAGGTITGSLTTGGATSVMIPAAIAGSDLTIQTGIGPSTGSTFSAVSQTLQANTAAINVNTNAATYNISLSSGNYVITPVVTATQGGENVDMTTKSVDITSGPGSKQSQQPNNGDQYQALTPILINTAGLHAGQTIDLVLTVSPTGGAQVVTRTIHVTISK